MVQLSRSLEYDDALGFSSDQETKHNTHTQTDTETYTDTYIHACEYRFMSVNAEAYYVRYGFVYPICLCIGFPDVPAMPPIFGIGLHKMAGPLCTFDRDP